MSDEPKQWWQTLPAIIAGIATLLTALTGLLVALNQLGVFKQAENKPTPAPEAVGATPYARTGVTPAKDATAPSQVAAETPAASEVPTPSQETKAVEKKLVSNAYLDYSRDLARWKKGYRGRSIALSETPPADNLTAPPFTGRKRLYGILSFGFKTKVGVILDVLDDKESRMVFAFDGDANFSDKPVHKTVNGVLPDPIEFQIEYPDGIRQKYAIRLDYLIGFAGPTGITRLQYHTACVHQGKVKLGEREYPVAIADDDADGLYSVSRATELYVDATGDGHDGKLTTLPASGAFSVAGTYYLVSDITPSGSRITVAQARFGEVVGQITEAQTGTPLSGAKIKLSPSYGSAVSESNGKYQIKAPEGEYWELSAILNGYVPEHSRRQRRVEAGKSLTVDVSLSPDTSATARSGSIRLAQGDSYHFLSGEKSQWVGGDFSVGVYRNGGAEFHANNAYQRGVLDLGDIGNIPLTQVEPRPENSYSRNSHAAAIVGHTYVSAAKEGEEGHYVIFRVIGVKMGEYVEIEFYYR